MDAEWAAAEAEALAEDDAASQMPLVGKASRVDPDAPRGSSRGSGRGGVVVPGGGGAGASKPSPLQQSAGPGDEDEDEDLPSYHEADELDELDDDDDEGDEIDVPVVPLTVGRRVATLQQRPRTASAPASMAEEYVVSPTFAVLDLDSDRKTARHMQMPARLSSTRTRQVLFGSDPAQRSGDTRGMAVARAVLRLLDEAFTNVVPMPAVTSLADTPSHRWPDDARRELFYRLLVELCSFAREAVAKDSMMVHLASPAYVLGDIHGNYQDLRLFASAFWPLGPDLTPARLLFLGDYVDRGPHSVECIAYLFALKVLNPDKVFLLRGNHELSYVNSDVELYGEGSYLYQCQRDFGGANGATLWQTSNDVMDHMPFAAVIDNKIFCVHGGIPRSISHYSSGAELSNRIESIPRPVFDSHVNGVGSIDDPESYHLADLLWSDPASSEQEARLDLWEGAFPPGFGTNPRRIGAGCEREDIIIFSREAVDHFQEATGYTHIIRAHDPPDLGFLPQKDARVLTVFSSSSYGGRFNSAAIVMVADGCVKFVTTGGADPTERFPEARVLG